MHLRRQLEVIHQFEWSTKSNPKARLRKEPIDLIKCFGKLRNNLLNNSLIIMTSRLQPNVKPTYALECLKVLSFTSHLRKKVLIRRKKRLLCRTTQIWTLITSQAGLEVKESSVAAMSLLTRKRKKAVQSGSLLLVRESVSSAPISQPPILSEKILWLPRIKMTQLRPSPSFKRSSMSILPGRALLVKDRHKQSQIAIQHLLPPLLMSEKRLMKSERSVRFRKQRNLPDLPPLKMSRHRDESSRGSQMHIRPTRKLNNK